VILVAAEDATGEREALGSAGVRVLNVPRGQGGLDLTAALDRLWDAGIRSVLCEGGGRLGRSLLAAGRVQRLYLFVAPMLYGGGVAAFPPAGRRIAGETVDVRRFGGDVLVVVDLEEPEPEGGAAVAAAGNG